MTNPGICKNMVIGLLLCLFAILHATDTEKRIHSHCTPLNSHWHGLKLLTRLPADAVAPGTTVEYVCHVDHGPYHYRINNLPEEFAVYPTPYHTCQENGAWSGKGPPICVDRVALENARHFVEERPQCNYCNKSNCSETENWAIVGQYGSHASDNSRDHHSYEIQRIMCEFDRPTYLNVMAFNPTSINSNKTLKSSATIKVHPNDVITEFSNDAASHHAKHCDSLKKSNEIFQNGSRIVICNYNGAYTRKVFLDFKFEKDADNYIGYDSSRYQYMGKPAPVFYNINSLNMSALGGGCPIGPTIPNGIILSGSLNGPSVKYGCKSNFTLTDPWTNLVSDGALTCMNGQWNYSIPACRRDNLENLKTAYQADDFAYLPNENLNAPHSSLGTDPQGNSKLVQSSTTKSDSDEESVDDDYEGITSLESKFDYQDDEKQLPTMSSALEANDEGNEGLHGCSSLKLNKIIIPSVSIIICAAIIIYIIRFSPLSKRKKETSSTSTMVSYSRIDAMDSGSKYHDVAIQQPGAYPGCGDSHVVNIQSTSPLAY